MCSFLCEAGTSDLWPESVRRNPLFCAAESVLIRVHLWFSFANT